MPRKGNRRRGGRRSRGAFAPLPAPLYHHRMVWTGTCSAKGTVAFTFVSREDKGAYRCVWLSVELTAEKPTICQLHIRGDSGPESETNFSPVMSIGVIPRKLMVRQPRQNGYWESGSGETTPKFGWLTNIGSNPVLYTAVGLLIEKVELSVATEVTEVLPHGTSFVFPSCSK